MSIAETPTAVRDIVDDNELRELWIVGREMERPPYFHAGKGGDMRLARALRVVQDGRVFPHSDGSYTVEGSEHRTYRVTDSCSCPQSQKGPSKHCYHSVAVALYVEWRKRCAPAPPLRSQVPATPLAEERAEAYDLATRIDDEALGNGYPVDDETLPLALGPSSIDERLAAPPTPQEAPMDDPYIPEPPAQDSATTAIVEPKNGTVAMTTPATSSLDTRALLESMAAWKEQRQILARYIQEQLKEGVDYYSLRIKGRDTKPTLSKAGSEKFLAILKLTASFQQDAATWTMLGSKEGVLCYTCTLLTRDGQVVGEGRGARTLAQDQGDINKAVKMAQKSAQIDAILRTGCLSDVFTQDVEPEAAPVSTPSSADLRQTIWRLVKAADATIATREACEAYVQRVTGLVLEPDNYGRIVDALGTGR